MTSDAGQLSDRSIMCQGLAWKGRGEREGRGGWERGREEGNGGAGREGGRVVYVGRVKGDRSWGEKDTWEVMGR